MMGMAHITPVTPSARRSTSSSYPAAGRVPDRADRYDRGETRPRSRAGRPNPAMEEQGAQRHRHRRRRHEGQVAAAAMIGDEVAPRHRRRRRDPVALERARAPGLVTVRGSANRLGGSRRPQRQHAKAIIVATNSDDACGARHLTAREARAQCQDHRRGPGRRDPAPPQRPGLDGGDRLCLRAVLLGIAVQILERCRDEDLAPDAASRFREVSRRGRGSPSTTPIAPRRRAASWRASTTNGSIVLRTVTRDLSADAER